MGIYWIILKIVKFRYVHYTSDTCYRLLSYRHKSKLNFNFFFHPLTKKWYDGNNWNNIEYCLANAEYTGFTDGYFSTIFMRKWCPCSTSPKNQHLQYLTTPIQKLNGPCLIFIKFNPYFEMQSTLKSSNFTFSQLKWTRWLFDFLVIFLR